MLKSCSRRVQLKRPTSTQNICTSHALLENCVAPPPPSTKGRIFCKRTFLSGSAELVAEAKARQKAQVMLPMRCNKINAEHMHYNLLPHQYDMGWGDSTPKARRTPLLIIFYMALKEHPHYFNWTIYLFTEKKKYNMNTIFAKHTLLERVKQTIYRRFGAHGGSQSTWMWLWEHQHFTNTIAGDFRIFRWFVWEFFEHDFPQRKLSQRETGTCACICVVSSVGTAHAIRILPSETLW